MTKKIKKVALRGSAQSLHPEAVRTGAPHPEDRLTVTIVLMPVAPPADLAEKIEAIRSAMPLGRPRLTEEEFKRIHVADDEHFERVRAFADSHNLSLAREATATREVKLEGTVEDLSNAFGVDLGHYAHRNVTFRGHEGPVHVPAELSECVETVLGLDDRPSDATTFIAAGLAGASFTPSWVARRYRLPSDLDGTGQRIAIIALGGGFHQDDLDHYFANLLGLKSPPTVRAISVLRSAGAGGLTNTPYPMRKLGLFIDTLNDPTLDFAGVDAALGCQVCTAQAMATLETTMDIQIAGAVAPGAAIDVYFTSDSKEGWRNGLLAALGLYPHTDPPDVEPATVISFSWGFGEQRSSSFVKDVHPVLEQAALRQVTVCCASGDLGSVGVESWTGDDDVANVSFPASDPYTLACGGTTAVGGPDEEIAWNTDW